MATGEGARGAAALLAGAELRGGARPEMAILGLPGVKKDEIWVGRDDRGVRQPPGHLSGHGKTLSGASSCGGGSGRRRSPGWRVPGSEAAYSLRPQVQKEKGPCLSHRGSWLGGVAAQDGRRRRLTAEREQSSWSRRRKAPQGSGATRFDEWRLCDATLGVIEVQETPAA